MDEKRLKEIEERCEAVTPGEWRTPPSHSGIVSESHGDIFYRGANGTCDDVRFILYAREDILYLLSELSQLRIAQSAAIEDLRQVQIFSNSCAFCKHDRSLSFCPNGDKEQCWQWRGTADGEEAEAKL